MDARDFRNLQEAYLEIYQEEVEQIDEISADLALRASKKAGEVAGQLSSLGGKKEKVLAKRKQQEKLYTLQAKKRVAKLKREEFGEDAFDYILEYLITEGYAETNQSAIAIMANMSEEWKDSILEEKKPLPWEKVEKKTKEMHDKFKNLVKGKNLGDLSKAYKLTDRMGKIYKATKPNFEND
jgi:hypothetical protein